jgi:hypothetical protein
MNNVVVWDEEAVLAPNTSTSSKTLPVLQERNFLIRNWSLLSADQITVTAKRRLSISTNLA